MIINDKLKYFLLPFHHILSFQLPGYTFVHCVCCRFPGCTDISVYREFHISDMSNVLIYGLICISTSFLLVMPSGNDETLLQSAVNGK